MKRPRVSRRPRTTSYTRPHALRDRFALFLATILVVPILASAATPVTAQAVTANTYTAYSVGISGGEPSIGFDPIRNAAMYGSGTNVKRLTWDESQTPARMSVADAKPQTAVTTLDAITIVDQLTGRSFNSQLAAVCSLASFSDNAGVSWTPSQGCGENTLLDHQSLGAGPFHAPIPANAVYQDSTYYCAQNGFNGACAMSVDGGLNFGPGVYAYNTAANDPNDPNPTFAAEGGACSALHGHIRVGPDGTAYLPLKGCGGQPDTQNGTNTEYIGGVPAMSISKDNGTTWLVHMIPNSNVPDGLGGTNAVENPDESDPSIGISRPSAAHPNGVLYYGWENGHNPSDIVNGPTTQAMIAVSFDDGTTWSTPTDVSSPLGLNNVQFPEVIAGNDNRAAFAYLATPAIGDDQANAFPKDPPWHLYVSSTGDFGHTWTTVDATPNDPVQRGCIDLQGTTIPPSDRTDICTQRNLLDFNDITVDREGRVLVAYADGCNTSCANNTKSGSSGAVDMVMRRTGGVGLYANPTATSVVCAPNPDLVGVSTACTATVTDTGGGTSVSTPSGTVDFASGGAGTFGSTSCVLTPMVTNGVSTCSVDYTPSATGSQTITSTYDGEIADAVSSGSTALTVTTSRSTATSVACSPNPLAAGAATSCKATVQDSDTGSPNTPAGTVGFTAGGAGTFGSAGCTLSATTTGVATCSVTFTPSATGPQTISASYGGDASHKPSGGATSIMSFAYAATNGGSFVIGDLSATGKVTFWGTKWSKANKLSGGSAPSTFKGYASQPSTNPPSCGGSWATPTGQSPPPPNSVPAYMAVLVSSSIGTSGSAISGNIVHIVVVKTDSGYSSDASHPGTGTVIASIC